MKEIIPLNDYLVLEELPTEEGVLVLESAEEPSNRGKVLKGPQNYSWGQSVIREGDEVLFLPHLFQTYQIGGKKILLGKQEAVIAVIK